MQERKYLFILCFLAVLEIASSFKTPTNSLSQSEDVKIYSIPSPNYELKQPEFVFNKQLRLNFTFHNENIELLLTEADKRTDTAVYSLDETKMHRIDIPESNTEETTAPQRYKGENASFSVICKWEAHYHHRCQVSGVFFNHGILWGVVPLHIGERTQKKNSTFYLKKYVGTWHRIFKPPSKDTVNWIWPKNSFAKERHTFQGRANRRRRSVKTNYVIDLTLILHADVYTTFIRALPRSYDYNQITYFIKEYYSEMTHAMTSMLQTMSTRKYNIGAKLTSLVYTYGKNSTALFHRRNINIFKFNEWVNQPWNNVAQMGDHVILLMIDDVHGWIENTMCTRNSTSIIQEMFGMQTAILAVHALALSMGVQHDHVGNDCDISDDYIMASYRFPAKETVNALNRFRFSRCSKKYLNAFLRQNGKTRCMLIDSNLTHSYEGYDLIPSGQFLSASQQCKLRFGNDSDVYECEGENFENQYGLCVNLACMRDGRCLEMVPLGKTSCGNRRWCHDGYCVPNRLAPEIPMSCWLGDKLEGPISPGSKITCKDIAYGYMHACYEKRISSSCCWTCFFLRSSQDNCPYGDRSSDCWENECSFYTTKRVIHDCCATCRVRSGSYRESCWRIGLVILAAISLKSHLL